MRFSWTSGKAARNRLKHGVDFADAVIALEIATGGRPCDVATLAAADIDRDGQITALDALLILQAAAGAINL